MAAYIPPQPDFVIVSQSFRAPAMELEKLPNLIGIQQNIEIIRLLQGLTESVRRIETRLDTLEAKLEHQSFNNMARLQNSYALFPNEPLTALISPITGEAIPNMPADSNSIAQMASN